MRNLLAAFYGDDFTGSTENLAQYCRSGLRGRLYFSPEYLDEDISELDVIGFAGTARALNTEGMSQEIMPALEAMESLAPQVIQYKICSTFDSSPQKGSIGYVMQLARQRWKECAFPILAATPEFGRYTAFSHHFTRYKGDICRLDQNPALANHPATPMLEADLRRHLAEQTDLPASALTLLDYATSDGGWHLLELAQETGAFTVMDATDDVQVRHAAGLILRLSQQRPTLAIAAQGLATGLGRLWSDAAPERSAVANTFSGVERLLVLSGSCSPQTRQQLKSLEEAGGKVLSLDLKMSLNSPSHVVEEMMPVIAEALDSHQLVAVVTSREEADIASELGGEPLAEAVGASFAQLARISAEQLGVRRVVFAGGDTSSHAMRHMGARALELDVIDPSQGGHLCRLVADSIAVSGIEVLLKGGQVGGDDFFVRAWCGTTSS